MTSYEPGSHVLAVRNADSETNTLYVFGEGTYVGDKIRPGWPEEPSDVDRKMIEETLQNADPVAQLKAVLDEFLNRNEITHEDYAARLATAEAQYTVEKAKPMEERVKQYWLSVASNPRIDLDNGGVVWGYQCWWGPVNSFMTRFGHMTWEKVPPPS
jgi:hypothetical protein